MRILSKHIHFKTRTFVVIINYSVLNPSQVRMALEQDTDDAWNLFNLMNLGDLIKGSAYRQGKLMTNIVFKQEDSERNINRVGIKRQKKI